MITLSCFPAVTVVTFWRDRRRVRAGIAIAAALLAAGCVSEPAPEEGSNEAGLTQALVEAAQTAEQANNYEAAADHYRRLAERMPDSLDPVLGQARNLRYSGTPRVAIRVLNSAIETRGEAPPLLLELAKAEFAAALTADADATVERLAPMTPDDWEVAALQGLLADRHEAYDVAEEHYRRALELSPNNTAVLNNYSLSLAQAGRLDEAIALLEPVATGAYSTVLTRQNLAMLYAIKGDMAAAQRLAETDLPADKALQNLTGFQSLTE